ncbi:hypothetical protein FE257_000029 [Aspergillus nanangensis]|uniref:NACHT domain-containing protein n=1 Tax=Aspergillus nanangensis TaxID=2582783 RepID=A0AAD4D0L3_ASPNN|nr:hypothetical protein FE257_000029 [Aspergillus nanangensis]
MEKDDFVIVERNHLHFPTLVHPTIPDGEPQVEITPEDLDRIRSWLSPTDFDGEGSEYQKHLTTRVTGTGDWLQQTEQYHRWRDEDAVRALWIQGIPGSGKSVVAAGLINILKEENVPVAFFFARRIIKSNSQPRHLVRDCTYQLLHHSIGLQEKLKGMVQRFPSVDEVPFQDLWQGFLSGVSEIPRAYIVFDALDELAVEKDNFLGLLGDLARMGSQSAKIIMTSRPEIHLQEQLKGPSIAMIRLTTLHVGKDIATYITHRVENQTTVELGQDQKTVLMNVLCEKARGLFLHARLTLDQILQPSTNPIDSQLQCLPGSLGDMYDGILQEHAARSGATQSFQLFLLTWITHASRPLRVAELVALIDSTVDRCGLEYGQDTKLMVHTACGPLIEILDDQTVQIIHHSFTEYLLDTSNSAITEQPTSARMFPAIVPAVAHGLLASRCIDYLSSGLFEGWPTDDSIREDCANAYQDSHRRRMAQFPFLQYASQNLLYHAAAYDIDDPELISKFDQLFQEGNHDFKSWKDFWSAGERTLNPGKFHPLHVASQAGFAVYTKHLLARGENPNLLDCRGRAPATLACMNGHSETLATLHDHGATLTTEDNDGLTAIHYAAKGNHVECLRRLLKTSAEGILRKAKPGRDRQLWGYDDHLGKSPMQYACELGNTASVSLLLQHLTPDTRRSAIPHWASRFGRTETLQTLLNYAEIVANVNKKDADGNTALFLAACGSFPKTMRLLLNHGADVHITSSDLNHRPKTQFDPDTLHDAQFTPLHGWVETATRAYRRRVPDDAEFEETATLLIEAGCDINARDRNGRSVLFWWRAIPQRSFHDDTCMHRFVSLLLKLGADPAVADHRGNTPLYMNSRAPDSGVIRALVAAGADINHARDGDLVTPLIDSVKHNCTNVVPFLENGADLNLQDSDGNTMLHHMWPKIFRLQDLGQWLAFADPTIKNKAGETFIYNRAEEYRDQNQVGCISWFVEKGLDLESRDRFGRTALLAHCSNRGFRFATSLIEASANAQSRDFQNKTCLHLLAQSSCYQCCSVHMWVSICEALISAGLNINSIDSEGNTPFLDAVTATCEERCIKARMEAIVQCGGITNIANHRGQTALHKAAGLRASLSSRGYTKVSERIERLLEPRMGIDIHARDNEGLMAVHHAAAASVETTWQLIQAGADITATANNGKTVLHFAAEGGQSNAVGLLCRLFEERRIPLYQKDESGRTALHYAAISGSHESVDCLLSHGLDANAGDNNGQTPLHAATEYQAPAWEVHETQDENEDSPHPSELSPGISLILPPLDRFIDWNSHNSTEARRNRSKSGTAIKPAQEPVMIQDTVRLLLNAGSNPSLRDKNRQSPLDLAILRRQDEIIYPLQRLEQDTNKDMAFVHQWFASRTSDENSVFNGMKIHREDSYGLLQTSITLGRQDLLKRSLSAGADPTLAGPEGLTPVHYVVHLGSIFMMESLIPYIKDWNDFTPPLLHAAVCRGQTNLAMVRLLIKCGVDVNAVYQNRRKSIAFDDASWYTAGHILTAGRYWWHISALEYLCQAGLDLERTNGRGHTALQCALRVKRGADGEIGFWNIEILDAILRLGGDINSLSPDNGTTALIVALREKKGPKIIQTLLNHGADVTIGEPPAIFEAVSSKDCEAVRAVLDAGADPNTEYEHPSSSKNNPKVVTPLLMRSIMTCSGAKPVRESKAVMALLLERGADPLRRLSDGSLVLHQICRYGGSIEPILDQTDTIDLETLDDGGSTPLHCACGPTHRMEDDQGNMRPWSTLIDAGANVNAQDASGSTPLHLAVQHGSPKMVTKLCEKGACKTLVDHRNLPPLYYALTAHHTYSAELSSMLFPTEGCLDLTGPNGETPLHLLAPRVAERTPPAFPWERLEGYEFRGDFWEYYDLYQRFADSGWDRNARDKDGNTPLFAYFTFPEAQGRRRRPGASLPLPATEYVEQMLCEHDVFALNNNGDTLLHVVAARQGCKQSTKLVLRLFGILMKAGLDPKQANKKGLSALDIAAAYGRDDILGLFATGN